MKRPGKSASKMYNSNNFLQNLSDKDKKMPKVAVSCEEIAKLLNLTNMA